jgi:hypothetical protein
MSAVYESAPLQLDDNENIRLIEIVYEPPQGDCDLIACKLHVGTTETGSTDPSQQ